MLRPKATLVANLIVLSLVVSGVKAHRGTNGRVDAQASVHMRDRGTAKEIRAEAYVRGTTGTHGAEDQHLHKGEIYLHIYLHRKGHHAGADPKGVFAYRFRWDVPLFGEAILTRPPLVDGRTILNECWIGLASSRGTIWTADPNDPNNKQLERFQGSAYTGALEFCHFANAASNASDPSINHEQLARDLSDEISSANNANSAIYLNGRIQTIDYDPSTLYVAELDNGVTYTLGTADLIDAYHETGRVPSVVQLNPLDGVTHASAPAKPRPRRLATTTWAKIKQ